MSAHENLYNDFLKTHQGRFRSEDILNVWKSIQDTCYSAEQIGEPEGGWLQHTYLCLRNKLFPHLPAPEDAEQFGAAREDLLRYMRKAYVYEHRHCDFDPTRDMLTLSDREVKEGDFTREYIRLKRRALDNYVYEFMRIGADITPFNTVGHICGVHYVAMYVAKQLYSAGVPVDLALVSGAAASHDIGKYGCRKNEEKRVPYLHYYYTDYCLTRFGLTKTAHIAANHSTWDLELEDLPVESLLLIYADFRTKSTRENGEEIIHFYSLKEAFDVILGKLDNVDEAKRQRYIRVYNKLRDFEGYMTEHGVVTEIADRAPSYSKYHEGPVMPVRRELALLDRSNVTEQIKYMAVDHNIRVMARFGRDAQFAGLIDAARNETDWKNVRTYIELLKEYSTYMTDRQKAQTLSLLYDFLAHRESDIREMTADAMGYIVARYRDEYKKELPEDIPAPDDNVTNLSMFREYIGMIMDPDRKHTDIHRKRITANADFFVRSVVTSCRGSCRHKYLEILQNYYEPELFSSPEGNIYADAEHEEKLIVLMSTALAISADLITDAFRMKVAELADAVKGKISRSVDLITLEVLNYHGFISEEELESRRRMVLGIEEGVLRDEQLSSMFLDDLKLHVSWNTKMANIAIMRQSAVTAADRSRLMQTATHFSNLIKVSETVSVRKEAGRSLLSILEMMSADQRNELMLELFNGLERDDYQFSGLIPDYLGVVVLHLDTAELREVIYELGRMIDTGHDNAAGAALNTAAVALENYTRCKGSGEWTEEKTKLLGLLMKGIAYYRTGVSREAMHAIGKHIFASRILSLEEKREIASHCFKRLLLVLSESSEEEEVDFYNNAATLNNIYRYITEYRAERGLPDFAPERPAAFFPGTFDPFSLGHKAIATTIRDMGFDVYLAIDEFSWSKKTLPHLLRREILQMSIADEEGLYIFPDDMPVNISNPEDLARLRDMFPGQDLYIAVGSDVVINASAYRKAPEENSIHTFNHILFEREARRIEGEGMNYPVLGKVIRLTLDKFYEDISSTRIRENVDLGRDISDLIDLAAQNFIYDNDLYIREPAYKHEIQARELNIRTFEPGTNTDREYFRKALEGNEAADILAEYLAREDIRKVTIETSDHVLSAAAGARRVRTSDLLEEFGDIETASYIRKNSGGEIAVIGAFYVSGGENVSYLRQILLTELLTMMISKDYSYAVFHPVCGEAADPLAVRTMISQGFINISEDPEHPLYAVDMRDPIAIFRDADTVIKAPLNKNPRVQKAFDTAHRQLLSVMRDLYPGKLLLSFNTSAVYSKIVDLATSANGVSAVPDPMRRRGPYLAVPFGKALSDIVVPNTVTKALRTEKYYRNDLENFDIREINGYLDLDEQARTIRSFNRPVILIDDLLHSGQRMEKIEMVLRHNNVDVHKVIVGLLTGNARDRMQVLDRDTESAYFLPSISMWMNERDCYPFLGGDSVERYGEGPATGRGLEKHPSVNLILPYTGFSFIGSGDPEDIFKYSMTCLENAYNIFTVLEQEYQKTFEKKLTLRRLGAVITVPRRPILGTGIRYDDTVSPSVFIANEIRRAKRLFLFSHNKAK